MFRVGRRRSGHQQGLQPGVVVGSNPPLYVRRDGHHVAGFDAVVGVAPADDAGAGLDGNDEGTRRGVGRDELPGSEVATDGLQVVGAEHVVCGESVVVVGAFGAEIGDGHIGSGRRTTGRVGPNTSTRSALPTRRRFGAIRPTGDTGESPDEGGGRADESAR